jgi:hypothetical protein
MTIIKVILSGVCLVGALYILARWVHRALYETIPAGLSWRAALAGGIIWLWSLAVPFGWNFWQGTTSWPISFNDHFLSDTQSSASDLAFQEFRVPRGDGQETVYRLNKVRRGAAAATLYLDENGAALPASTLKMTGVTQNGAKVNFEVVRNAQGNIDRGPDGTAPTRYRAEDGRVMTSTELGTLSHPSTGHFWVGFFLFVLQVLIWTACFAFVLQFLPAHALLFGVSSTLLWIFILSFL